MSARTSTQAALATSQLRAAREGEPRALHPEAPFRHAVVVANPIAGRGRGVSVARELSLGLAHLGVEVRVHETAGRGEARAALRALQEPPDLVVAVGGDGTLREVLDGLPGPQVPVAVLPVGTGNVLAASLGLPRDVDRALEVIAARRSVAVDVASASGELVLFSAGVGLDAEIVAELERARRGPITRGTWLAAARRALRRWRPPELSVEIDGQALPGTFAQVLVANTPRYGAVFRLAPTARTDDGRFEAYLFPSSGRPRARLLAAACQGLVRPLPGRHGLLRAVARRLRVTAPEPVPVQVDGDLRGTTPLDLELTGRQHRLLVP